MNRQDCILLFQKIYPRFFEDENIRSLSEKSVCDEMILPLAEFDPSIYNRNFNGNVSFGFCEGGLDEIKKAVEKVDEDWLNFFGEKQKIYCGYMGKKVVSFCIADDMGVFDINGKKIKVCGPGCVGTVPEYRNKGIGLMMVKNLTEIFKNEGYDYSYIHYTGVPNWYEKLGYKTFVRWNSKGII